MWKIKQEYFWEYIKEYNKQCIHFVNDLEPIDVNECHKRVKDQVDSKINKTNLISTESLNTCYLKSFKNFVNKSESEIIPFTEQRENNIPASSFDIIPALVIQNYLVRGELNALSMASSICDSMKKAPKAICGNLGSKEFFEDINEVPNPNYDPQEKSTTSVTTSAILIAMLVGAILVVLCAYIGKVILDRSLKIHLNNEIDNTVMNYMSMRNQQRELDASKVVEV